MNITFRKICNTYDETFMGQKLWYYPVAGCDVVSATANAPGFTSLTAIARHFGWDCDMIVHEAAACNSKGEVLIISSVVPTLILVPATKGRGNTNKQMWNLVQALHKLDAKCLHFTHFGFLQNKLPIQEVTVILDYFLNLIIPNKLESLVFDIDERRIKQFYGLMRPSFAYDDQDAPPL
jgi:hypothetical protein